MTYSSTLLLFLGNFRGWEWVIIIVVFLMLFGGAATIRKVMRNAGRGVNAFKQGLEDAKAEMRKPINVVVEDKRNAPDGKPDEPEATAKPEDKGAPAEPQAAAKDVDR